MGAAYAIYAEEDYSILTETYTKLLVGVDDYLNSYHYHGWPQQPHF